MRRQSFVIGALLLAVGGFIAKIIGAFYKIPLTNILGTMGVGIYYLIFPLYSLLLVLSSSGINIAVSKLVSVERENRCKKNEMTILKMGLLISFFISFIFSFLMIILSKQISTFQGNINSYMGYIAIAPSLICASLIAVLRGYFQGIENMIPTSVSIIFEQIIKLVFGLVLSSKFMSMGVEFAVLGAVLGVTISELGAMILVIINFIIYKKRLDYKFLFKEKLKCEKIIKKKLKIGQCKNLNHVNHGLMLDTKLNKVKIHRKYLTNSLAISKLLKYSIPATLTSVMSSVIALVDSFLIINLLTKSGVSSTVATALYGLNNGVVNTLIGLPIVIISAVSTAVVPNLSSLVVRNKSDEVEFRIAFFLKITWIVSLFMFFVFLILSPEFIKILFRNGLSDNVIDEFAFATKLLTLASVSILYYGFLQVFTAVLQAFDNPILPFVALFISFVFRTLICYVLLQNNKINIFGVVIANLIYLSIANIICFYFVDKRIKFDINLKNFIFKPIICAVLSSLVIYLCKFCFKFLPIWLYSSISGLVGGVIFLWLVFVLGVFNSRELKQIPKFSIKILKKSKR